MLVHAMALHYGIVTIVCNKHYPNFHGTQFRKQRDRACNTMKSHSQRYIVYVPCVCTVLVQQAMCTFNKLHAYVPHRINSINIVQTYTSM